MQTVIAIITPVFSVIALGFICARVKLLDDVATAALNRFVFFVAAPCLIFPKILLMEFPQITPWSFLLGYYLGTFSVFVLGVLVSRYALRRVTDAQAMDGFACSYSNMVLMGIPLVLTGLGDEASLPLFMILAIHSMLLFTVTTLIIEISRGHSEEITPTIRRSFTSLGQNPIILTMLAGALGNLLDFKPPALALESIRFLGEATPACALFALGLSLGQCTIRGSLINAAFMVPLKNIIHPVLVAILVTRVSDVPPLWQKTAILLAAMPTGVNVYLFARYYKINEAQITSGIVVSTAVSLVTITVLLSWLQV